MVQKQGCCLSILRPENFYLNVETNEIQIHNFRGVGKFNQNGVLTQFPDIIYSIQNFNWEKPIKPDSYTQLEYMQSYLQQTLFEPSVAPEVILKRPLELTPSIDVWAFASLVYGIIFGQYPPSFIKTVGDHQKKIIDNTKSPVQPSEYYFYDIYPNEMIKEILQEDYNLDYKDDESAMIYALDGKSFGSMFKQVFGNVTTHSESVFSEFSNILDILAICLSPNPARRPNLNALIKSGVFSQDRHQESLAKQFSELLFSFKSPIIQIVDVFKSLRQMCAEVIRDNAVVLNLYERIIHHLDFLHATLSSESKNLKKKIKNKAKSL